MPLAEPTFNNKEYASREEAYSNYSVTLAHVLRGTGYFIPLVRKLIHKGYLTAALHLLDMWVNDRRYTIGAFKSYLSECLELCGITPGTPPGGGRLGIDEDEPEIRQMATIKPTPSQVIDHMIAKGVDLERISHESVMILSKIAVNYGLPTIDHILERIASRQSGFERITFADLIED